MNQHKLVAKCIFVITALYICGVCESNRKTTEDNILNQETKKAGTEGVVKAEPEKLDEGISEDTRVLVKELKKSIDEKLRLQRKDLEEVAVTTKANGRKMTFHFTIVSLFACGVIGVSGLVLGFGAYRSYVDNKRILGRMEKKLDREFGPWLRDKKKEHEKAMKEICATLSTKYDTEMDQLMYHVRLRFIIQQTSPKAEEVYPLLTPLSSNPRLEYEPLFAKIIELNIHPEITAKAQDGLTKLK